MKRALAMALGAMMVAGSAAPASAASHIDFSGYYRVNYMIDTNRGHGTEDQSYTDHYFDDRLLIEMVFSPTDEIAVHWQLRGPNRQRWGNGGAQSLVTKFVYGEIKQDWGTVLVGRIDDSLDHYGLASLGYEPGFGIYQNYGPFDRADTIDAVRYTNRWDNGFGLMAQYGKIDSNDKYGEDAGGNVVNYTLGHSDKDADRVQVEGSYMWDGGGASLGFMWDRDATGAYHGTLSEGVLYRGGLPYAAAYQDKTNAFFVNPAVMHSWGNFSVHFEGMAGWGSTDYIYDDPNNGRTRSASVDSDGYGAYLDFDYNYGPGNVNLAGWWVSGSKLGDRESSSLVDLTGGNFHPLLVAYGWTGNGNWKGNNHIESKANSIAIANNAYNNFVMPALKSGNFFLNADFITVPGTDERIDFLGLDADTQDRGRFTTFNKDTDANHWAISLSGTHALTDDISMHYAAAYLALNNPNYSIVKSYDRTTGKYSYQEQEKDLGIELDLAFKFQLLDNLSFTSAFGYMFTGDAYKELRGYNVTARDGAGNATAAKAKWGDGDDTYVWYNTLQFNF